MKIRKSLLGLLVIASFSLGFSISESKYSDSIQSNSDTELSKNFDLSKLNYVYDIIQKNFIYLPEVNKTTMEDKLIKGLLAGLSDPHSNYFDKEESKMFVESLDQNLVGIGAELNNSEENIQIVRILVGSPAEKAGLLPDDVIFSVDSEDISELNIYDVIKKIRGEVGTQVKLGIYREGKDPFEVTIIRDVINLESVSHKELDEKLYYIRINQFSDDTAKEFQSAATSALMNNSKGLILDLRFNGGGYLDSAVDIMGEFLERNKSAVITSRLNSANKDTLYTSGPSRLSGIPLVILINKGSASASEILAGTLHDYGKATLIGETSYGKGSVQEVIPFADGSTLKLTVSKWKTGLGNDIDKKGLTPDIPVSISEDDIKNDTDRQLNEAIDFLKLNKLVKN